VLGFQFGSTFLDHSVKPIKSLLPLIAAACGKPEHLAFMFTAQIGFVSGSDHASRNVVRPIVPSKPEHRASCNHARRIARPFKHGFDPMTPGRTRHGQTSHVPDCGRNKIREGVPVAAGEVDRSQSINRETPDKAAPIRRRPLKCQNDDGQERTESTGVTERSHATIGPKRYRRRRKNGSQFAEG
jgi:hypothetical protein